MKALIPDYGEVQFDPMNPEGNFYDLYCVCICDGEEVIKTEHYLDENDFKSALTNVYGRVILSDEFEQYDHCTVICWGNLYECDCTNHFVYVADPE